MTEPSGRSGSNILKRDSIQCFHMLQSVGEEGNRMEVCSKELDSFLCIFFHALSQVVIFWHCTALTVQGLLSKEHISPCMEWSLCPGAARSVWGSVPSSLQDWVLPLRGELRADMVNRPPGLRTHPQPPAVLTDSVRAGLCPELCLCSCMQHFGFDLFSSQPILVLRETLCSLK